MTATAGAMVGAPLTPEVKRYRLFLFLSIVANLSVGIFILFWPNEFADVAGQPQPSPDTWPRHWGMQLWAINLLYLPEYWNPAVNHWPNWVGIGVRLTFLGVLLHARRRVRADGDLRRAVGAGAAVHLPPGRQTQGLSRRRSACRLQNCRGGGIFRSNISGRFDNYDGSGNQARINWEVKFAKGGVGAIISSFVPVQLRGRIVPNYAMIDDDRHIPFWRAVGKAVHEHDCKFIMQLSHGGRQRDIPASRSRPA